MPDTSARTNKDVIVWAIEESVRTLDDVANRVRVQPDIVQAWIDGRVAPSQGELTLLAEAVRRPWPVFYFTEVPSEASLPALCGRRAAAGSAICSRTSGSRFAARGAISAPPRSWWTQPAVPVSADPVCLPIPLMRPGRCGRGLGSRKTSKQVGGMIGKRICIGARRSRIRVCCAWRSDLGVRGCAVSRCRIPAAPLLP